MAKRKPMAVGPSDEEVRALLDRYRCPVPFHEVRTRFLGNIATPAMAASPIEAVKGLWGGQLPKFDTIGAANELIGAPVVGLWNRLTRHQGRGAPFRLTRNDIPETRDGLACIALTRREEIDGFVEGLFGQDAKIDLPARAHRGMAELSEIRSTMEDTRCLAKDLTKLATADDIAATLRHIRELTKFVEHEMHEVVLSCTRARRQMLAVMPTSKPVLH
jgi:hypothetical protein